jgi:type II secretory pathway pseudopilin PulG
MKPIVIDRRSVHRGQAVVLALLLTAVVITVALSVVSQSVVDIRTASQSQEVVQAFTAAEAGIDQILTSAAEGSTMPFNNVSVGNATFNARITNLGEGQGTSQNEAYIFPRDMVSGDSQTLWFVSHGTGGSLTCPCSTFGSSPSFNVYWGKPGELEVPAIILDIYYKTNPGNTGYSDVRVARVAVDGNSSSRGGFASRSNAGNLSAGGQDFAYSYSVNVNSLGIPEASYGTPNGLQMIRVKMLYSTGKPQPVGFDFEYAGINNGGLPSQGFVPESQGSVGNYATINLSSVYPYPDPPAIFDYALFAGSGDIAK